MLDPRAPNRLPEAASERFPAASSTDGVRSRAPAPASGPWAVHLQLSRCSHYDNP